VEYKLDVATHDVRFYLQNNLGSDTDSIIVTLTDTNSKSCTTDGATAVEFAVPALANGQKSAVITFRNGTDDTYCDTSGSSFKGNINVVYVKSTETQNHTASGSISGKFD
jgi:hypothetical protein